MNGFTFYHDDMDRVCPAAAHIRKVNPRQGAKDKRTRRILRRGAPFGPEYEEGEVSPPAGGRGLAFIAYMTSTKNQFGLLSKDWMNDPRNPSGGGADMIVGQLGAGIPRRFCVQREPEVEIEDEQKSWVRMTGGAFLFAPSLKVLRSLAPDQTQDEGADAMIDVQPEDLEGALKQYAIYERPSDHPGGYVVREWLVTAGTALPGDSSRAETLDAARALLPEGVTRISGQDPNEPQIVEVWM
jgi:hypothetical protein